jgi:hypothetical protein
MTPPYEIYVHDLRPDNHSSLGTLPMLAEDELDRLQAFARLSSRQDKRVLLEDRRL